MYGWSSKASDTSNTSAPSYGTTETSRIVHGQTQARKRVVIFLSVFLLSGFCSEYTIATTVSLMCIRELALSRNKMAVKNGCLYIITMNWLWSAHVKYLVVGNLVHPGYSSNYGFNKIIGNTAVLFYNFQISY